MPSLTRWLIAVAVLAVLVPTAVLAAPASPSNDAKKTEGPAEKIRKALDQTIDLDMTDQSLNQAITQLREQTKLNIVLDRMTVINLMGMDPEQSPVTLKLQGVKVRSALRTMLSQYNLGFAIVGETVVVTTEDMAMHRQMKQRVNVELDNVKLDAALKQLSKETATNLTVDPRVAKDAQTAITLQLEDVPLETAVRLMAEMADLKPVRVGNVLFVTSKTNATEMRSDPDLAPSTEPRDRMMEMMWREKMMIQQQMMQLPGAVAPAVPLPPPPPEGDKDPDKPKEKPPADGDKKSEPPVEKRSDGSDKR